MNEPQNCSMKSEECQEVREDLEALSTQNGTSPQDDNGGSKLPEHWNELPSKYQQRLLSMGINPSEVTSQSALNRRLNEPDMQEKLRIFREIIDADRKEAQRKEDSSKESPKKGRGRPPGSKNKETARGDTHSERLVEIISSEAELLKSTEDDLAIKTNYKGKSLIMEIDGGKSRFVNWLRLRFDELYKEYPVEHSIVKAVNYIRAKADYEGKPVEMFTRIGKYENNLYLNLCNDENEVIEITPDGWHKLEGECPVYFRETRGMKELPFPLEGGNTSHLFDLLPIDRNTPEAMLVVAWLLGVFMPDANYPVLVIKGPDGSGKSSLTTTLRNLIDPKNPPSIAIPNNYQNLCITARGSQIVAIENVSKISEQQSDWFCTLSTGLGHSTRELFTNKDEISFYGKRPLIINSINHVVNRNDLISRSIFVELPIISEEKRKLDEEVSELFIDNHPKVLGLLLTAVSRALRDYRKVRSELGRLPRMASFAAWVESMNEILGWERGEFLLAYKENIGKEMIGTLEASPVGRTILRCLENPNLKRELQGGIRSIELLDFLYQRALDKDIDSGSWPKSPRGLTSELERLETAFLLQKIEIRWGEHTNKGNITTIRKIE